jgi:hypothetical protein
MRMKSRSYLLSYCWVNLEQMIELSVAQEEEDYDVLLHLERPTNGGRHRGIFILG